MEDDDQRVPEPPLGRIRDWATVTLDLGDGPRTYRRELNTMPQWAGSCWYYLRYLDPTNDHEFVDPRVERYWMTGVDAEGRPARGGVDLYVGGVEHALLHLLYSRFWHKALFDLGHVSTPEPFQRLFNQGYILAAAYVDERGFYVDAADVREDAEGRFSFNGRSVNREFGKMGKSLKNSVSPDEIYAEYGADTLRLYEMAMGPLDADRPWSTTDIIGAHRLLQRAWRAIVDERSGALRVVESQDEEERRLLHRTIAAVRHDMSGLRFNTAIARITELDECGRETADGLTLMLAPFAPHLGEELWARLGHEPSVGWQPFPTPDAALLAEGSVTLVVQVDGKLRDRLQAPPDADAAAVEAMAMASPRVRAILAGRRPRKVVARPPTLVNLVVG
jgi:leucyl-tRNA synthetase